MLVQGGPNAKYELLGGKFKPVQVVRGTLVSDPSNKSSHIYI